MATKSAIRNLKSAIPCFLFLILFGFPLPLHAQQSSGQLVKVEYDSNKDITQISLNPFILASKKFEELRLGAIAAHPGKVKVRPTDVNLIFLSFSATDSSKYETARKVTITADGQRIALGEARHSKEVQNGLFVESMAVLITMDVFLRVCHSKEVTMKLGITEVALSPKQIEILRIASSYMTE